MMIDVNGLTVKYSDGTAALSSVSFKADEGESIALLGANGSGKSTLLLALVGAVDFSGEIITDGIRLGNKTLREIRKKTGIVFQNPDDQLFSLSVFDDVAFAARKNGYSESETKARVDEVLALLGIEHLAQKMPHRMSGGEKRMAAVASALTLSPSVLLLDEPTAFLDHASRRQLINTINNLHQTKITATHDLLFASETAERVIILKNGRIAEDADISLLYDEKRMSACGLEALKNCS